MKIVLVEDSSVEQCADALVIGVYSDGLTSDATVVDVACGGIITRLLEAGEFRAEVGKSLKLYFLAGVRASVVELIGLGSKATFDRGSACRAGGVAMRGVSDRRYQSVALTIDRSWSEELQTSFISGALVGSQGVGLYKSDTKRACSVELRVGGVAASVMEEARIIGDAINFTRRLVNEPASVLYPETFAAEIESLADESLGVEVEVWDEHRLLRERCGAMLAVAQGSARPPRLAIVRYAGAEAEAPWTAFVGKGVTFDSGGLSLKPSASMLAMKADMAGAATVVSAVQAIAQLRRPVNVMGLVGLVENMPAASAYKLGDVLRTRSGRTVEVHNTDAEGRLVLADVLNVAVEHGADRLIDVATLTGACVVALGNNVAGVMSNDQKWADRVIASASRCGERVWQLPMFAEYGDTIKGTVADLKNVGEGRAGGAISAAKLLEHFVDGRPWVHLDVAGPAFSDKAKPWVESGATGAMVRTLIEVANENPVGVRQ